MSQLKIKNGNEWVDIPAGGVGVPSGGNAGDVLVKSSAVDYATEWKSKGLTLLWTNSNPTASFAAQMVSLDLGGYDAVLVISCLATSATKQDNAMLVMVGDSARLCSTDNANNAFNRDIDVLSSGVKFYTGQTGTTSQNGSRIPLKIYGIKF